MDNNNLVELTADIVSAHVTRNRVDLGQVGQLIAQVHETLAGLGKQEEEAQAKVPVVSIRASVKPDRLICMECGRESKMLKRHLMTAHNMSPDQYRQDYGLPANYPMVASEYADRRRELAKSIGLGRKKGEKVATRRGRKPKASAAGPEQTPES